MRIDHQELIGLIIAYTCVGVFISTAIATVFDLFKIKKLPADIRKTLNKVLVVEIVVIAVGAFAGFLNPKPIAQKVARFDRVEGEKLQLEKAISLIEVPVDFSADTASAPGHTVAAAPYLHGAGISIVEMKPSASEIVLMNNRALYQGRAVKPTSSQNILTQVNTNNVTASFTIRFSEPLAAVRFVRPTLYADTESGVTHPAWSAHALDAAGHELSSQSEGLTRSFSTVPASSYTLPATGLEGISTVRFDSDPSLNGKPFAGFSAVLIEQLTVIRRNK